LISLRDFRPKLRVLSISASVFWTSSPMMWMPAFLRQLADRTESSSSSTLLRRFSLSFSLWPASSCTFSSSVSSKLMKMSSWSFRILAA